MLFSSMKEAQEIVVNVFDRKNFDDLTPEQMNCIHGLYIALDVLDRYEETHCGDENEVPGKLGEIVDEISCQAVQAAAEDIVGTISELVVCFRDQNASGC